MSTSTSSVNVSIVGDGSAGKSSLIASLTSNGFSPHYKQTVGCDFYEKTIKLRDIQVTVRIWDIGGQSIHSQNFKNYIGNSDVVFLLYDVTSLESFDNLVDWNSNLKKHTSLSKVYVLGNKMDMYGQRQVSDEQHHDAIKSYKYKGGFLVSAKTGENILKAFYKAVSTYCNITLSDSELSAVDSVITVSVNKSGEDEGRTSIADRIEEEDRLAALEYERRRQEELEGMKGCCRIM